MVVAGERGTGTGPSGRGGALRDIARRTDCASPHELRDGCVLRRMRDGDMSAPPRDGTRAAVRFWAQRTRESLRRAVDLALAAVACADEFYGAIRACAARAGIDMPCAVAVIDIRGYPRERQPVL